MKNRMLLLVCGIPIASVVFGMVMFYFAFSSQDRFEQTDGEPMSKVSWRTTEQQP